MNLDYNSSEFDDDNDVFGGMVVATIAFLVAVAFICCGLGALALCILT